MPKFLLSFLSFLSKMLVDQRGEINPEKSDTDETEVVEEASDTAEQEVEEEKPAEKDWRTEKYGENWKESHQYKDDTISYLRGELDKAKKRTPQKTIEDHEEGPVAKSQGSDTGRKPIEADSTLENVTSVKDLVEYLEKNQTSKFEQVLTEREKKANFRTAMQRARREFGGDPESGLPSFAELEQEVLIPLVEKQPIILKLLRELDGDQGQAAYTLAMMLKFQGGFMDVLRGQGREELGKKIDEVTKQAIRAKGGKTGAKSTKQTAADIANMTPEQIEREIEKVKNHAA